VCQKLVSLILDFGEGNEAGKSQISACVAQGCINPGCQVAVATEFSFVALSIELLSVAPHIYGLSMCNVPLFTFF